MESDIKDKLTAHITNLIINTKHNLTSLKYFPLHFGNIEVELTNNEYIVRFTYDRGDIYREVEIINAPQFNNEQLIYCHSTPHNEPYELLIKAIDEFIGN